MNRVILAFACVLLATSSAAAQNIRNAGRIGLTTLPLRYQALSYESAFDEFGFESSGTDVDGGETQQVLAGFGAPGFGINLGAVLGEGALLGGHVLVVHQAIETSSTTTSKMTAVEVLPYFEYVFASSGFARGYLGGMAGISFADSDVGPATAMFVSGPTGGAHVFLGPNASIDLGAVAFYLNGTSGERTVSGVTLAALVGVSAWWGGGTRQAAQRDASALESRDEFVRRTPAPPYPGAGVTPGAGGTAERTFDRARNLHVIRARFELGAAVLLLVSMPQVELETIYVQLNVPRYAARPESCAALAALINDEPVQATGVTKSEERMIELGGRVVFERFKVLARPHATFGVEGCGQQWRLVESQMPELIKFLQLVSQVATDVQTGKLPRSAAQPAPPAVQPVPEAAPAPAAPAAPTPAAPAPGSSPTQTPDPSRSSPRPE